MIDWICIGTALIINRIHVIGQHIDMIILPTNLFLNHNLLLLVKFLFGKYRMQYHIGHQFQTHRNMGIITIDMIGRISLLRVSVEIRTDLIILNKKVSRLSNGIRAFKTHMFYQMRGTPYTIRFKNGANIAKNMNAANWNGLRRFLINDSKSIGKSMGFRARHSLY